MRSRGEASGWRFSAGKYNPNPLTEWAVFHEPMHGVTRTLVRVTLAYFRGKNRGVLRHPPISALCFVPVGVIKEGAG